MIRTTLLGLALSVSFSAMAAPPVKGKPAMALAAKDRVVQMWKSPSCGCCEGWAQHMRQAGFTVKSNPISEMEKKKDTLGIPVAGRSCHTSQIGNKVFEGHIPAKDIADFMKAPPKGSKGLAVPGMPMGSPGMDHPGSPKHAYEVKLIQSKGQLGKTFRKH